MNSSSNSSNLLIVVVVVIVFKSFIHHSNNLLIRFTERTKSSENKSALNKVSGSILLQFYILVLGTGFELCFLPSFYYWLCGHRLEMLAWSNLLFLIGIQSNPGQTRHEHIF